MAGEVRPIAMGVGKIKFGTVGDGVPGADLKDYPLPTKGSVAYNFADPKEVKIEIEGVLIGFFQMFFPPVVSTSPPASSLRTSFDGVGIENST